MVVALVAGVRIAKAVPRLRTLARCGSATVGLSAHFAIAALVARVACDSLGVVGQLLVIAPVFLLIHAQSWFGGRARDGAGSAEPETAPAPSKTEIASLLHDTVGQGLTVIAMRARSAARSKDVRELTVIDQATTRTMAELRQVLGYLHESRERPDAIVDDCLIDVVNWFRTAGVAVDFVAYGPEENVPELIRPVLVRVAREALSNTLKHDRDAHVVVELHVSPMLRLAIRSRSSPDEACCPVPCAARTGSSGHGTRMMQRLVTRHGGSIRIAGGRGEFAVEAVFH